MTKGENSFARALGKAVMVPLVVSALAPMLAAMTACTGGKREGTEKTAPYMDVERARAIQSVGQPLPNRVEVLALAQSLQGRAAKEAAGGRSIELSTMAGRLYERLWRLEGHAQDAERALDAYRSAAQTPASPGACEAAEHAALLAGEVARDATTAYVELYRVERRFGVIPPSEADGPARAACLETVTRALTRLAAFRPPREVLEAVDREVTSAGPSPGALAAGKPPITFQAAPKGSAASLPIGDPEATTAARPRVVAVDQWPGKEAARVVISLDRRATFHAGDEAGAGGKGARTFVDIDGAELGDVAHDVTLRGIVKRVTTEATVRGARVTLDLNGTAYRRVFYLEEPYRIVVDVAKRPPQAATRGRRTVRRVVLDPGHGGKDTGAIGATGLAEKDVTLDIAHRAAPVLARSGIQVLLTRDDDRTVSLEERTARANAFGADLFVSIHCNASENHARRGVETYVLDTTSDAIANQVAARENSTSAAASAEVGQLLASMRLSDQSIRSTKLAELLQRATVTSLRKVDPRTVDGGVHRAGFYVLVGARMPSVLFETSYLSNAEDERHLADEDVRQRLADAIVNAVRAFREGR